MEDCALAWGDSRRLNEAEYEARIRVIKSAREREVDWHKGAVHRAWALTIVKAAAGLELGDVGWTERPRVTSMIVVHCLL